MVRVLFIVKIILINKTVYINLKRAETLSVTNPCKKVQSKSKLRETGSTANKNPKIREVLKQELLFWVKLQWNLPWLQTNVRGCRVFEAWQRKLLVLTLQGMLVKAELLVYNISWLHELHEENFDWPDLTNYWLN